MTSEGMADSYTELMSGMRVVERLVWQSCCPLNIIHNRHQRLTNDFPCGSHLKDEMTSKINGTVRMRLAWLATSPIALT